MEKVKYHLEHSVCSADMEENEKKELIRLLEMDISSILQYVVLLLRKINTMSNWKEDHIPSSTKQ